MEIARVCIPINEVTPAEWDCLKAEFPTLRGHPHIWAKGRGFWPRPADDCVIEERPKGRFFLVLSEADHSTVP
jgi:hypothetical protein